VFSEGTQSHSSLSFPRLHVIKTSVPCPPFSVIRNVHCGLRTLSLDFCIPPLPLETGDTGVRLLFGPLVARDTRRILDPSARSFDAARIFFPPLMLPSVSIRTFPLVHRARVFPISRQSSAREGWRTLARRQPYRTRIPLDAPLSFCFSSAGIK